jgi:hypothetical protein
LVTLEWVVVPSGLPLRGQDMPLDMHVLSVSDETAVSDGSESMAVVLRDPLGWNGVMSSAKETAYVTSPSGGTSCRLHVAACSPVTEELAGRGADSVLGAGRLLAGSDKSPKLLVSQPS